MSHKTSPIRVGLVGLSSRLAGHNSPGFWAASAHLPALLQSPHYEVRGLCNSSLEAAQRAIKLYGFHPEKVTAYGDTAAMAADKEIDLVVCCVNVEHHYNIVKPALLAKKMVFCEWPLAANLAEMKELADLSDKMGVKTVVGLQGRFSNSVRAIRTRIGDGEGKIGRVLSTSMQVHGMLLGATVPQGLEYFARKDAGGNLLTVRTIHRKYTTSYPFPHLDGPFQHLTRFQLIVLDMLVSTLGEITTISIVAGTQRPTRALTDSDGKCIDPTFPCDTPDHISIHGKLQSDALFSYTLRGGAPFRNTPVLDWRIYGERGEIRVTTTGMGLQMDRDVCVEVEYSGRTDLVETVNLDNDDDDANPAASLDSAARNTARLYHSFATDQVAGDERYLTFQKSLYWAKLIEDVYASY